VKQKADAGDIVKVTFSCKESTATGKEDDIIMADSIHTVRKTLRLMPGEAGQLAERAREAGLCEAEYLRLLISQKPNDYPQIREMLRSLMNEVNAIGVNINQVVKNNNSRLYSREDKELLIAYMKKVHLTMKEVVEKIGNQ